MNESKAKRLIVAYTVGAVCLLVILVSVLIYQLVAIGVKSKKEKNLQSAISQYEQLIEDEKKELDAYKKRWYIEFRARELGYEYADDIELGK